VNIQPCRSKFYRGVFKSGTYTKSAGYRPKKQGAQIYRHRHPPIAVPPFILFLGKRRNDKHDDRWQQQKFFHNTNIASQDAESNLN